MENTQEELSGSASGDIRSHEFKKSFRGYDPAEVESYLDQLATSLEDAQRQTDVYREKVKELDKQLATFHSVENVLQQTLAHAQETSGRTVENARKEAEIILHQAQLKASEILEQSRTDLAKITERIAVLVAKKDSIVSRLTQMLNSELDLVKSLGQDPELAHHHPGSSESRATEKSDVEDII